MKIGPSPAGADIHATPAWTLSTERHLSRHLHKTDQQKYGTGKTPGDKQTITNQNGNKRWKRPATIPKQKKRNIEQQTHCGKTWQQHYEKRVQISDHCRFQKRHTHTHTHTHNATKAAALHTWTTPEKHPVVHTCSEHLPEINYPQQAQRRSDFENITNEPGKYSKCENSSMNKDKIALSLEKHISCKPKTKNTYQNYQTSTTADTHATSAWTPPIQTQWSTQLHDKNKDPHTKLKRHMDPTKQWRTTNGT